MTKPNYYRVKNAMLFACLIANGIGVGVVQFLPQRSAAALTPEILRLADDINWFFLPASFMLPWILILLYEKPIRTCLKRDFEKKPLSDEILEAILYTLDKFQAGAKKEDDVTLVVIKMQG